MDLNFYEMIQKNFQKSASNIGALSQNETVILSIERAAKVMVQCYRNGGRIYIVGNGGSAADAQHFAAELVSKLHRNRTPIPAIALTVDTSLLTAIGNDYGFKYSFSRQVEGLMTNNDVLLAITTSGMSENILEALRSCAQKGAQSILLTGRLGGMAVEQKLGNHVIIAPGETTDAIQEAHLIIYHTIAHLIEIGLIELGLIKYV